MLLGGGPKRRYMYDNPNFYKNPQRVADAYSQHEETEHEIAKLEHTIETLKFEKEKLKVDEVARRENVEKIKAEERKGTFFFAIPMLAYDCSF